MAISSQESAMARLIDHLRDRQIGTSSRLAVPQSCPTAMGRLGSNLIKISRSRGLRRRKASRLRLRRDLGDERQRKDHELQVRHPIFWWQAPRYAVRLEMMKP